MSRGLLLWLMDLFWRLLWPPGSCQGQDELLPRRMARARATLDWNAEGTVRARRTTCVTASPRWMGQGHSLASEGPSPDRLYALCAAAVGAGPTEKRVIHGS